MWLGDLHPAAQVAVIVMAGLCLLALIGLFARRDGGRNAPS